MTKADRKIHPNLHILKLTFAHFAAGLVLFLIAMAAAVMVIPDLAAGGTFRQPEGWLLAHMLLLGWASTVCMGASFQLIQVILRTSLYSRTLGWFHFAVYVAGVLLILAGFVRDGRLIGPGGMLTTIGIMLYAANLAATIVRKREWNPFVFGVGLGVFAFLMTAGSGTLIGLRFAYDVPIRYDALFAGHLWLGLGGWLSGLVVVFSFKLLPMFYVSPMRPGRSAYWMVGAFHLGVWLEIAALWSGLGWLSVSGKIGMAAALIAFVRFALGIRGTGRNKHPVGAVRVAFWLVPANCAAFLLWLGLSWTGADRELLTEVLIALLIAGWFTPSILAYLSKILPFLWWANRFQTRDKKKDAVLLSKMLREDRLTVILAGYLTGVAAVLAGLIANAPTVSGIGQIFSVCCVVLYVVETARTFRY